MSKHAGIGFITHPFPFCTDGVVDKHRNEKNLNLLALIWQLYDIHGCRTFNIAYVCKPKTPDFTFVTFICFIARNLDSCFIENSLMVQ